ncbi:dixin-like isoform X3 [Gouania willdenowi]|uniref:dixin-like isoform X3 n=1 Tax=Gouania willdenowi TaxID=441366 RepID=UPI0010562A6C|nr:dixin-like isoform X3 [Gouania willdenowi]
MMIASLSRGSLLDEVLHGGFQEQQQLAAYVSWVNAQLKKKPGLKPINDLRRDLQDGLVLTELIEIVAGEVLKGVHVPPQNKEESRKNVEEVLRFISSRNIRMPHISARDIVDGNLKSVMRIILALAAHFKPSANHRTTAGHGGNPAKGHAHHNPLSTVALAQDAAAALVSARLQASLPPTSTNNHSGWRSAGERNVCVRTLVQQYERGAPDEHENNQRCSSVSTLSSPGTPAGDLSDRHQQVCTELESSGDSSCKADVECQVECLGESLEKEVQDTRKMVSALQALLLHGSLPEDQQDAPLTLDQENTEHHLVVIRSRLDQSMEEAQELKRELMCCKMEMRNLQGVKEAQQQRLCTQETSILHMKQELLRASMTKDELSTQNAELLWKLEEGNRMWGEAKKEIIQKDRLLQQLKHQLEESQKSQTELQRELDHKSNTLQEIMGRDLQHSSEHNGYSYTGNQSTSMSDAEEVQLLRDALRSLRNNFGEHDPQHHTLDTLEQGIVSLMDRLHVLHSHRGRGKSPRRKDVFVLNAEINPAHNGSSSFTKILYFTGKSSTPSMIHISKRLGEVTLKDVKAAVDQEGNYRYHFKALDPEFGTVKEEVFLDAAVVPGWEGKIVAWLEDDCGDARPV